MIRTAITWVVIFVVLLLLAGALGWLGVGELLLVLLISIGLTAGALQVLRRIRAPTTGP